MTNISRILKEKSFLHRKFVPKKKIKNIGYPEYAVVKKEKRSIVVIVSIFLCRPSVFIRVNLLSFHFEGAVHEIKSR